jgi:hypothetical protein
MTLYTYSTQPATYFSNNNLSSAQTLLLILPRDLETLADYLRVLRRYGQEEDGVQHGDYGGQEGKKVLFERDR